jgi:protein-S-isoprenylcysteine O-methyltransferase Ste14
MMSLAHSWSYQYRLPITLGCCITAWTLATLSRPLILEGTAADLWWDAGGWLLLASGMGLRLWATLCIAGRKRKSLVDFGPYSLCRNPLYWGTLLIALAVMAFFKSVTFAVIGLLPLAIYLIGVVPTEERYLTTRLGAEYEDYCRRVPRWWPNFAHYRAATVPWSLAAPAVRRECWCLTLCLVLLAPGVQVSCFVRGHDWLGYWWPLP